MKKLSTDIDRDNFETKDDPTDTRHLLWMVGSAVFLGIAPLAFVIGYSHKIDAFLNKPQGALTLFGIFGVIGIVWFVWRVKKMME